MTLNYVLIDFNVTSKFAAASSDKMHAVDVCAIWTLKSTAFAQITWQ